jgi:hypothetical protein
VASPEQWGAFLNVGSSDIYNVVIHTTGTSFGANVLEDLNGAETPELDIVLFPTTGAVGAPKSTSPPQRSSEVQTYVRAQEWWPVAAKKAILSSIRTYSFLRALPSDQFGDLKNHLEELLRSVSIDPDLIA